MEFNPNLGKNRELDNRYTVLIVDDDESMRDTLEAIIKDKYRVIKAEDGESALNAFEKEDIHVILLDIKLPGIGGLEILKKIKSVYEDDIEIIMITAVRDVDIAVKAMKLGAYDYITKEFSYDQVLSTVDRAIDKIRHKMELLYLRSEMERYIEEDFIVGNTKEMKGIHYLVQRIARLPATILIMGETGTGKELLARVIHKESERAEKAFVTVNLAAIPSELVESTLFGHERGAFTGAYKQRIGKFELANGGTIFLDEIGELKYELQSKLLRVLQEKTFERVGGTKSIKVDVRVIAATNRDLKNAVREGSFREDLFYRINVIPIFLPPLRERVEDIPLFVRHFILKYNRRFNKNIEDVREEALRILSNYPWPGNIRELENLIERLIAVHEGNVIYPEDIPIEYHISTIRNRVKTKKLLKDALEAFERNIILKTLERNRGLRRETANELGISLGTLKYKINRLGIKRELKDKNLW